MFQFGNSEGYCSTFHKNYLNAYQKDGVGEIDEDFVSFTDDEEFGYDAFVRLIGDFRVKLAQICAVGL